MTPDDRFGPRLSAWLHEEAGHRVPNHLTEVLVQTSGTRQRPWWSSPGRWLPMDLAARSNSFTPPRLAPIVLIGLLVLVLAGLLALAAGSFQRRVPEPFGPARNGLLAHWVSGDIYVAEADGTGSRAIVTGPDQDVAPWFSRDGTRMLFIREIDTDTQQLMVVDADGSGLRPLVEAPMQSLGWVEWSPRDDRVAVVHEVDGALAISVLQATGDPTPVTFDLGDLDVDNNSVYWLPPDGSELVFTAQGPETGMHPALYAIKSDGTGLRMVAPAGADQYRDLSVAPDGRTIAYAAIGPDDTADGIGWHVHVLDLGTGTDRTVAKAPLSHAEYQPVFSPDGSSLLVRRSAIGEGHAQLVLAGLDGDPGTEIGPTFDVGSAMAYGFSPDGKTVWLIVYGGGTQMIDLATGEFEPLDPGILNLTSWQRLAP